MGATYIDTVTLGLTLKLMLALNEFGLDPQEWHIAEGGFTKQVLIVNCQDPEFRLVGEISGSQWKSIEVLSI
jgi:hypothetical protein